MRARGRPRACRGRARSPAPAPAAAATSVISTSGRRFRRGLTAAATLTGCRPSRRSAGPSRNRRMSAPAWGAASAPAWGAAPRAAVPGGGARTRAPEWRSPAAVRHGHGDVGGRRRGRASLRLARLGERGREPRHVRQRNARRGWRAGSGSGVAVAVGFAATGGAAAAGDEPPAPIAATASKRRGRRRPAGASSTAPSTSRLRALDRLLLPGARQASMRFGLCPPRITRRTYFPRTSPIEIRIVIRAPARR